MAHSIIELSVKSEYYFIEEENPIIIEVKLIKVSKFPEFAAINSTIVSFIRVIKDLSKMVTILMVSNFSFITKFIIDLARLVAVVIKTVMSIIFMAKIIISTIIITTNKPLVIRFIVD